VAARGKEAAAIATEKRRRSPQKCTWKKENLMNKRIMVVEDDESLRVLYQDVLEDEGYDVLTAGDGQEALDMLGHNKPDLLLLDIGLPGMDGREVLARLIKRHEGVKVIVLTSHLEYAGDPLCRAVDGFVYKSIDLGPLKQKVRQVLEKVA
jgi:CheY-like chemotaxis protein